MMIDYTIYYKRELSTTLPWSTENNWDLFISAYNSSERVNTVFKKVPAKQKQWVILPEYKYYTNEYPDGKVFSSSADHEVDFILDYFEELSLGIENQNICIDITGFIKPYAMVLFRHLMKIGLKKVDVIYSEPSYYTKREETEFYGNVTEIRQVAGFEGVHMHDVSNDLLIIGAGYGNELIAQVAQNKDQAKKMQMFGFPSLQADMYQENILRFELASEAVGMRAWKDPRHLFAPANDPFVTATVLSQTVARERSRYGISNLYLCPLATEAQTLGFILYYLQECINQSVSMIYPFCDSYPKCTSKGISRIWKYTVEL